jgi:prephenate dehydrogenase
VRGGKGADPVSASGGSPASGSVVPEGEGNTGELWHPSGARVGIVGLGLMGGSLARDLAALGAHVLGLDLDSETLDAAMAAGVVHEALPGWGLSRRSVFHTGTFPGGSDLVPVGQTGADPGATASASPGHSSAPWNASALASIPMDALVLAVPVAAALPLLASAAPHLSHVPLVTDVGSTKASITSAAGGLGLGERFVGSHPMAGSHLSGWKASRTGLFRDARVYLCPVPKTAREAEEGWTAPGWGHEAVDGDAAGPGWGHEAVEGDAGGAPPGIGSPFPREALRRARGLWAAVGARTELMDPAAHDRLLAWTSHLPQAASSALALALAGAGVRPGDLGPGGRDMTRLAGSSPSLWTGIALDNGGFLVEGLEALERELARLRESLERRDGRAVHEFFSGATSWRP